MREQNCVGDAMAAAPADDTGPMLSALVVEDDSAIAARVARLVEGLGWRAIVVETAAAARAALAREPVDLIYLDRMLADGEDGLKLLAWFRALEGPMPGTLVASRLSTPADHVLGLDEGADDYIDKPFDDEELSARLRALARRVRNVRAPQSVLVWGRLEVRTLNRVALWDDRRIDMMPLTFSLLHTLAAARGEWVSRQALWRAAWPDQASVAPRDYVINVAIRRLREALAGCSDGPQIETGERLGYRLVVQAP